MLASAWLFAAVLGAAPPTTLDAARSDEATVLREERDALRRAIDEADGASQAATRALTTEVEALATELEKLQSDNAARERRLPVGERARATETQERQLVELVGQIGSWLVAHGITAASDGTPPELLPRRIEAALDTIDRSGGLRVEKGATYFATDGAPQQGDVLRIGEVAAMTWDARGTALLPTPEGLQEVAGIPPLREPTAAGERVRVVLHDPDGRADPEAWLDPTWQSTMKRGGPLMWVLLGLGCVALLITLERALMIAWIAARWRAALARIEALAAAAPAVRERGLANENTWIAAPLVIVAQQAAHDAHGRAEIEERATQAVIVARERLFRRLSMLSLCAGVAPLAGLLGTVNGMITTFSVVTTKGTSDAQLLAGGISEALLTTQFGLTIAIPALIAHALLSRGARRVLVAIEQAVLRHIHGVGTHDHHHAPDRASPQTSRLAEVSVDE